MEVIRLGEEIETAISWALFTGDVYSLWDLRKQVPVGHPNRERYFSQIDHCLSRFDDRLAREM